MPLSPLSCRVPAFDGNLTQPPAGRHSNVMSDNEVVEADERVAEREAAYLSDASLEDEEFEISVLKSKMLDIEAGTKQ